MKDIEVGDLVQVPGEYRGVVFAVFTDGHYGVTVGCTPAYFSRAELTLLGKSTNVPVGINPAEPNERAGR